MRDFEVMAAGGALDSAGAGRGHWCHWGRGAAPILPAVLLDCPPTFTALAPVHLHPCAPAGGQDEQIDEDLVIEGGAAQLAPNVTCPITQKQVRVVAAGGCARGTYAPMPACPLGVRAVCRAAPAARSLPPTPCRPLLSVQLLDLEDPVQDARG